jgi:hypothetical protein
VSGDAAIDIDLATATALTPTKIKGKMLIPGGNAGTLGGTSVGFVRVNTPTNAFLGGTPKIDASADGSSFEYDCEGATILRNYVIQKQDGAASGLTFKGYPAEGESIEGFMAPPAISIQRQGIYDPIPLDGAPATSFARVNFTGAGNAVQWIVTTLGPGAKTLAPPRLSGALEEQAKKATRAQLILLEEPNPELFVFMKFAFGRPFNVTP